VGVGVSVGILVEVFVDLVFVDFSEFLVVMFEVFVGVFLAVGDEKVKVVVLGVGSGVWFV
jgi:hypothetical protein